MPAPINLERLYEDHAQALFSFLLSLTRNEADTRDLLQGLFIKLAQRPGLLEGVREQRPFLLRLAQNLAIDMFRRRGAVQRHSDQLARELEGAPLFEPASEPDELAFRKALAAALGELPAEQRAVVHLKLWEGLTFEKIAKLLEIPLNTAASRYRYGLDKLRQRLRPLYDEIK
jgi:RNA polymerase sigma-70 factor (ECF subfamily)